MAERKNLPGGEPRPMVEKKPVYDAYDVAQIQSMAYEGCPNVEVEVPRSEPVSKAEALN